MEGCIEKLLPFSCLFSHVLPRSLSPTLTRLARPLTRRSKIVLACVVPARKVRVSLARVHSFTWLRCARVTQQQVTPSSCAPLREALTWRGQCTSGEQLDANYPFCVALNCLDSSADVRSRGVQKQSSVCKLHDARIITVIFYFVKNRRD